MATTWILVAESSRARILETHSAQDPLQEVKSLDHPEARMKQSELVSDNAGRRFANAGPKRHGMSDPVSWPEEHAGRFAKDLGEELESARAAGKFDRLILAASPKFLGMLRDELAPGTAESVVHEYDKNWLSESTETIRKHLPEYL